VFTGQYQVL